jgi:hypothetical protein
VVQPPEHEGYTYKYIFYNPQTVWLLLKVNTKRAIMLHVLFVTRNINSSIHVQRNRRVFVFTRVMSASLLTNPK